ncbi:MAG: IS200/IS605 family transposase [Bacteroidota bacterium]
MQGQYYRLIYHAVWAARMREPLIDDSLRLKLHKYLHDKVIEYGGTIMAVGGTDDHVHLVLAMPPQAAPAQFIGRLKGSSSHWVNHFHNPGGGFAWQGGYGAFTVADPDLDRVCAYVRNQLQHHQQGTTIAAYEDLTHRNVLCNAR